MAISVKHKFVSTVPDKPTPGLVRPSNWNEEHDIIVPENTILGRNVSGVGPALALAPSEVAAMIGGGGGGLTSVEDDHAPKLGGDLDLNGHGIPGIDYVSLSNKPTLGTAAAHAEGDFATAAQGAKADSALQSFDVAAAVHAATGKTTPVDADELGLVDSADSNVLKKLTWANLKAAFKAYFNPREVLTANRTYYVRLTNGDDSNTGLVDSNGGAFKTAQKAIDTVSALDLSIYNVTIRVSEGPCTENIVLKSLIGAGLVTLQGDTTTPSNVVLNPASGSCVRVDNFVGRWTVTGFKTVSSGGAIQFLVINGAAVSIGAMDWGDAAGNGIQLYGGVGARITYSGGTKTISASSFGYHIFLDNNAIYYGGGLTTTLTGNPTFITYAYATNGANLRNGVETFSGSVTSGKKYDVTMNATIANSGNTYPGPTAGTTATGGQYV